MSEAEKIAKIKDLLETIASEVAEARKILRGENV